MAPYADVLNDQQIADVVSFIQTSWGNAGGKATADQVAKLRKTAVPVSARGFPLVHPDPSRATPANQAAGTSG
jgi:hypothetical protein